MLRVAFLIFYIKYYTLLLHPRWFYHGPPILCRYLVCFHFRKKNWFFWVCVPHRVLQYPPSLSNASMHRVSKIRLCLATWWQQIKSGIQTNASAWVNQWSLSLMFVNTRICSLSGIVYFSRATNDIIVRSDPYRRQLPFTLDEDLFQVADHRPNDRRNYSSSSTSKWNQGQEAQMRLWYLNSEVSQNSWSVESN